LVTTHPIITGISHIFDLPVCHR